MERSDEAPARPGPADSRLPSLTGLRFVAAMTVLCAHTGYLFFMGASPAHDPTDYIFAVGGVGLTFFFVLSGFILTYVARDEDTRSAFLRRRLVKIFPNHLVTLAATVVLMLAAGVTVSFTNTAPSVLLLQSWLPVQDAIMGHGTNSPSWSLTCELLFYVCFPWLLTLVRRIRPERLWGWTGAVTAAILVVPFIAQLLPDRPTMWWGGDMSWWQYWFVYHFPPVRMLEFVLGILVARAVLSGRWIRIGLLPAGLLSVASYAVLAQLPGVFAWMSLSALPLALVIGAAATRDIEGRRTGFGNRAMVWLGEISFALYIVHYPVIYYGPMRAVDPEHAFQIRSFAEALRDVSLTFGISLALAWLLYVTVERPAMRRWSRGRPPPAAGVPGEARDSAKAL